VAAWPESARLECTLGFGSFSVPRRWIPLYVRGDKELDSGRVEIRRKDREGRVLSLETYAYRSASRLECPVLMDEDCASLNVSLRSGSHVLAESELRPGEKVFPGHIALCAGMPSAVQRSLSGLLEPKEPIQVVAFKPGELPGIVLDYDCVSLLATADPGLSLSPSQTQALVAWVAGGGRLMLTGVKAEGKSILSAFGLGAARDSVMAYGLGRVAAFMTEASDLPRMGLDDALRSAVGLQPYGKDRRVVAGRVFSRDYPPPIPDSDTAKPASPLAISLIIWAGAMSSLFFVRKRRFAYLCVLCLVSTALAVPCGLLLDSAWHRGARCALRVLALPEASGVLADAAFRVSSTPHFAENPIGPAAIGFDVSETGRIRADGAPGWKHLSWKSRFSLNSGGRGRLEVTGYLPNLVVEGTGMEEAVASFSLESGLPRAADPGRRGPLAYYSAVSDTWWLWRPTARLWARTEDAPPDFAPCAAWLESLPAQMGKPGVLAGIDRFESMRFGLGGASFDSAVWASPFGAGEGGE
jgi:hypothetical protein